MGNNPPDKRHLKLVPTPDPNSSICDDPLSMLPRSAPGEPICWSRTPVRPYLVVIQGGDSAPEAELSPTGEPHTLQENKSHGPGEYLEGEG